MNQIVSVNAVNRNDALNRRLSSMTQELRSAWGQVDKSDISQWGMDTTTDFGKSLKRRVKNVGKLVTVVAGGSLREVRDACKAYKDEQLINHLDKRIHEAVATGQKIISGTTTTLSELKRAFKDNPGEVGPHLLTMVVVSLIVSGGPDGDGGVPDLDLKVGIGAHRSIFSHSILMGAALETAILSLLRIIQLAHKNLPDKHDPLWDKLLQHSHNFLDAANKGAGIGMAYHLLVDGLAQPAPYHDIPLSMPMEVHQAGFVANAITEAIDVGKKPSAHSTSTQGSASLDTGKPAPLKTGGLTVIELPHSPSSDTRTPNSSAERAHIEVLRRPHTIIPEFAKHLTARERELLENYGGWLIAIASGELTPLTDTQFGIAQVSRGSKRPETELEWLWYAYSRFMKAS